MPGSPVSLVTVTSMSYLRHLAADDGDVALLTGYREAGDAPPVYYRWDQRSTVTDNGGTAVAGKRTRKGSGRWLALHDGTVDLRSFGVLDAETPADGAFAAALGDESVSRILVRTGIRLARQHVIGRSNLELDFGGQMIDATALEDQAVLAVRGVPEVDGQRTVSIPARPEHTDLLPMGDTAGVDPGSWWTVSSADGTLGHLVQITEVLGGGLVRVGYKCGWPLPETLLTWTPVDPVAGVSIVNGTVLGAAVVEASHAVGVRVTRMHSVDAAGDVATVSLAYCDSVTVSACTARDPLVATRSLVSASGCLFARIADCAAWGAGEVVSLERCAYSRVVGCRGQTGSLVLAGAREHDLMVEASAGSIVASAGSSRRVTVRQHVGGQVLVPATSELTAEDVHVTDGELLVSDDGSVLRGVRAPSLRYATGAGRSRRPSTAHGCELGSLAGVEVTSPSSTRHLTFVSCRLAGASGTAFRGTGPLSFIECVIVGDSSGSAVGIASRSLVLDGTELTDVSIILDGSADQAVSAHGGTTFTGSVTGVPVLARGGSGVTSWHLRDVISQAETAHLSLAGGGNQVRIVGCTFIGGSLNLPPGAFDSADSYLHVARTVERAVDPSISAEQGGIGRLLVP